MKLLSIRLILIIALSLIIIISILLNIGTVLLLTGNPSEQHNSNEIQTMLLHAPNWTDKSWQQTLQHRLLVLNTDVILYDQAGQVIYQNSSYPHFSPPFEKVLIVNHTHILGTAAIYQCTLFTFIMLLASFIALFILLLTLTWLVVFIAVTILKPLSTLSKAAHQVAHNNLDFAFPTSRFREIAEVFQSFTLMSEALHNSLLRQAEVEQERRLFISAIAHDLRTPLFSLRGHLEGLAAGLATTPEKASKYIEVCQSRASILERLVSDLFAYTQLEFLEQVPRQEPVEIGELIQHTLESLEPQAKMKHLKLVAHKPLGPCVVQADAHLLTRVFENLLDNALRYTPPEGTISVTWRAQQELMIFTIADTGPGIQPADLPRLFTPLYRSDPSRSRHTGGSGLGLVIAQRILHAHGGELNATNAGCNGGAVFTGSLLQKDTSSRQTTTHHDPKVGVCPGV